MWLWGIIVCAVLAAVLLIITFAHIEAGMRTRNKWLALTVCALAVFIGLLVCKPRPRTEYVDYMPEPSPVLEEVKKPETASKTSDAAKQSGTTGWTSGEKSQPPREKSPADQDENGEDVEDAEDNDAEPEEYMDPVLEEILALKRAAEENAANRPSGSDYADLWTLINPDSYQAKQRVNPELSQEMRVNSRDEAPDGQDMGDKGTEGDDDRAVDTDGEAGEPEDRDQQAATARVTASSLNVRDQGSIEGRVIGSLSKGTEVEVIGDPEYSDWIKVRLESGQTGWVMKKYLDFTS